MVRCTPNYGPSRLELPLSPTPGVIWPARVGLQLTQSGPFGSAPNNDLGAGNVVKYDPKLSLRAPTFQPPICRQGV